MTSYKKSNRQANVWKKKHTTVRKRETKITIRSLSPFQCNCRD